MNLNLHKAYKLRVRPYILLFKMSNLKGVELVDLMYVLQTHTHTHTHTLMKQRQEGGCMVAWST